MSDSKQHSRAKTGQSSVPTKEDSVPDYSDPRIDLFRTLEGHIILEMDDPRKSIALAQLKSIEEQYEVVAAENARMREATTRIHKMSATTEAYEALQEQYEVLKSERDELENRLALRRGFHKDDREALQEQLETVTAERDRLKRRLMRVTQPEILREASTPASEPESA